MKTPQLNLFRHRWKPKLSRRGYLNVTFHHFYNQYYKKENKSSLKIEDETLARKVFETMMMKVFERMIVDKYIFKMPSRLGMVYIADNINTTGFYRDWGSTFKKNSGKIVLKYNHETGGTSPRIRWMKIVRNKYIDMYRFKPTRGVAGEKWGYRGLWDYVLNTFRDPFKKNYRGHLI